MIANIFTNGHGSRCRIFPILVHRFLTISEICSRLSQPAQFPHYSVSWFGNLNPATSWEILFSNVKYLISGFKRLEHKVSYHAQETKKNTKYGRIRVVSVKLYIDDFHWKQNSYIDKVRIIGMRISIDMQLKHYLVFEIEDLLRIYVP